MTTGLQILRGDPAPPARPDAKASGLASKGKRERGIIYSVIWKAVN